MSGSPMIMWEPDSKTTNSTVPLCSSRSSAIKLSLRVTTSSTEWVVLASPRVTLPDIGRTKGSSILRYRLTSLGEMYEAWIAPESNKTLSNWMSVFLRTIAPSLCIAEIFPTSGCKLRNDWRKTSAKEGSLKLRFNTVSWSGPWAACLRTSPSIRLCCFWYGLDPPGVLLTIPRGL